MNPDLLLRHFDRVADAPDAIPRLRKLILDLAVRGKLVTQDESDEPASELQKRISTQKARLVDPRKVRSAIPPAVSEAPFSLPSSWCWSQIAEIGQLSPRNDAPGEADASFVPMPMISAEYGVANDHQVNRWGEIKKGYTHFAEGDVAVAKITPCFENGKSTVFRNLTGSIGSGTTELHVVRPILVNPEYVLIFFKCPHVIKTGIPKMTGTAGQKRLPAEYFAHAPFPLPPLPEQRRIVAKVDELMTLCDRLEAAREGREATRDRLAAASLRRLNAPAQSPDVFVSYARFALANLTAVTTRPNQIKHLRNTVLNLAIQGRLTRGPNEEVASVDLDSSKRFSRQCQLSSDASSVSTPAHWSVMPLARAASLIVDCPHSTPRWTPSGKICVRTNQFQPGHLNLEDCRFVSEATYVERIQRLRPTEDDILYSREGGILGVACRIPADVELCLGQRMMLIRSSAMIRPAFLELVLNSPAITAIARAKTTGGAAPRVNVSTVKTYPIPIPPIPEQERIVAKVYELMELCDRLEASLVSGEDHRRRLLGALLAEALAPVQMAIA